VRPQTTDRRHLLRTKHVVAAGYRVRDGGSTPPASTIFPFGATVGRLVPFLGESAFRLGLKDLGWANLGFASGGLLGSWGKVG